MKPRAPIIEVMKLLRQQIDPRVAVRSELAILWLKPRHPFFPESFLQSRRESESVHQNCVKCDKCYILSGALYCLTIHLHFIPVQW